VALFHNSRPDEETIEYKPLLFKIVHADNIPDVPIKGKRQ